MGSHYHYRHVLTRHAPLHSDGSNNNNIFEVLILLVPIPLLLYSVFPPRKNLLIGLIYVLSIFVTLIQIIRLLSITHQTSQIDTSTLIIWSLIGVSLGITAASLISFAPLFKSFLSSEIDTFRLSLKIDHAKMAVKRAGKDSPTWQKVVMSLGYGELKRQGRESKNESGLESRSGYRMDAWNTEGGEWSAEDPNFEMGFIKTTEVIISREGSMWEEPKST